MAFVIDLSAVVVDIAILYAAAMWMLRHRIAFPFPMTEASKIFAVAFSVQFLFYLVFAIYPVDIIVRQYFVRVSIIAVALAQAIPLTVAFHVYWNQQRKP